MPCQSRGTQLITEYRGAHYYDHILADGAYPYVGENSEILSVAEVAALLRCSKAHVCKAIGGKVKGVTPLPALSMGRRKLVRRQSLESWLTHNDPASAGAILERSHNGSP